MVGQRPGCLLQKCDLSYSFLCIERDDLRPCTRYAKRDGSWLVPQGCNGQWPCNSTALYGVGATCAGKFPPWHPLAKRTGQRAACPLFDDPRRLP